MTSLALTRTRPMPTKRPRSGACKVIDIVTRKHRGSAGAYVSADAVAFFERSLCDAKSGAITGVVAVTVGPTREYHTFVQRGPHATLIEFIGRMYVLLHDIAKNT